MRILKITLILAIIVSVVWANSGRRNLSDIPKATKGYISLTFDDGPNTNETVKLLDVLKNHPGAKATFYVNGSRFNEQTIPVVKRTIAEGHDVDNHGFFHYSHGIGHPDSKDPDGKTMHLNTYALARENLKRNSEAIYGVTGYWPFAFRAPFFEYGSWMKGLDVELNMPFTDARYDTNDWMQGNQSNPQGMASALVSGVKDGLIILMHDAPVGNRQGTVDAVAIFVPQLIAQGYVFVTVRELFMIKQAQPERFQSPNDNFKPNAALPINEHSASGVRWNHEDFWEDKEWWTKDYWSCPTPPWERSNLGDCKEPIIKTCNICGQLNCSINHKKCEVCDEYDCQKEHITCNICDDEDCQKEHILCDICDEYDCQKEHIQCEKCEEYDDECICEEPSVSIKPANRKDASFAFAGIQNGQINLQLKAGNYTAELFNLQGRLIGKVEINAINGINTIGLRTDKLSKGMFILNVKQAEISVLRHKIFVK